MEILILQHQIQDSFPVIHLLRRCFDFLVKIDRRIALLRQVFLDELQHFSLVLPLMPTHIYPVNIF